MKRLILIILISGFTGLFCFSAHEISDMLQSGDVEMMSTALSEIDEEFNNLSGISHQYAEMEFKAIKRLVDLGLREFERKVNVVKEDLKGSHNEQLEHELNLSEKSLNDIEAKLSSIKNKVDKLDNTRTSQSGEDSTGGRKIGINDNEDVLSRAINTIKELIKNLTRQSGSKSVDVNDGSGYGSGASGPSSTTIDPTTGGFSDSDKDKDGPDEPFDGP